MIHADNTTRFSNEYFKYDPISVADAVPDPQTGRLENRQPVTEIHGAHGSGIPGTSFMELGRTNGIVFMYQSASQKNEFELAF